MLVRSLEVGYYFGYLGDIHQKILIRFEAIIPTHYPSPLEIELELIIMNICINKSGKSSVLNYTGHTAWFNCCMQHSVSLSHSPRIISGEMSRSRKLALILSVALTAVDEQSLTNTILRLLS
jgi:hypothetical protein